MRSGHSWLRKMSFGKCEMKPAGSGWDLGHNPQNGEHRTEVDELHRGPGPFVSQLSPKGWKMDLFLRPRRLNSQGKGRQDGAKLGRDSHRSVLVTWPYVHISIRKLGHLWNTQGVKNYRRVDTTPSSSVFFSHLLFVLYFYFLFFLLRMWWAIV